MYMLHVCLWLFSFIWHAKDKEVLYIPCSKVGLDLWKWMRLKKTIKCKLLSQKFGYNNPQSNMLKQHWAPFCHLLGNISARWSPIYSKTGSCNRSAGGDMVRIKCWVCHFNGTIAVVLHVGLCPVVHCATGFQFNSHCDQVHFILI